MLHAQPPGFFPALRFRIAVAQGEPNSVEDIAVLLLDSKGVEIPDEYGDPPNCLVRTDSAGNGTGSAYIEGLALPSTGRFVFRFVCAKGSEVASIPVEVERD